MGVSQDVAVLADDEARTEIQFVAAFVLFGHIGHVRHQTLEKLVKRIVVGKLAQIHAVFFGIVGTLHRFGRLDIDHCLPFLLEQLGKVGQQHVDAAVVFLGFDALYQLTAFIVVAEKTFHFVAPAQHQCRSGYHCQICVLFVHGVSFYYRWLLYCLKLKPDCKRNPPYPHPLDMPPFLSK